jgi:hypothetical protein
MKKITIVTVLCLAVGLSSFSSPSNIENKITQKAANTLTGMFAGAEELNWSNTDTYLKATFILNEKVMFAYFNQSGEFIGISRNMLSSTLPINLQIQLKMSYSNGWITELYEFAGVDSTDYFATIETAGQKIFLKSSGSNNWSVYKKVKK